MSEYQGQGYSCTLFHYVLTGIINTKIIKINNNIVECLISVVSYSISAFISPIFIQNMKRYK